MRILERVEAIRGEEHMRLRASLRRANEAMEALREKLEAERHPDPATLDMFGDPKSGRMGNPEDPPPKPRMELGPLAVVWRPFEAQLLERVDTWEMDLWPLVRRWVMGEPVAQAVQTVASGMLARRTKLEPLLKEVRLQVGFIGPMRAPMMAVFSALDASDTAEADVVPALISGKVDVAERTLEGAPPRMMSSAEIARNLRTQTRMVRPVHSETDRGGFFGALGRFMGWKS